MPKELNLMRQSRSRQEQLLLPNPSAAPRTIVRVEKNLNTFGFFTPSSKRLRTLSKTVTLQVRTDEGQRVQAKATIYPAAELGLPTTADQDKYFAFQKIIEQIRKRDGLVVNPVRFSSAAMIETLRMTDGGRNYREIWEWLRRMTLTGVESEGVVYFAGRKKYARDVFHVFQRSVAMGEVLEDGAIAEENYVWLSEWQLENVNNRHTLPIDYDVYRTLQLHIAKALVPLLQIWFYASRREQCAERKYSDLCLLLGLQCFKALSRIKQQFGPSLDHLKEKGFLWSWDLTKTTDESDYKLCLWAGSAFVSAADIRAAENPERTVLLSARQGEILRALVDRGVREDRARQLLIDLPEEQPALDQVEWGDVEVKRKERTREPIQNPPGFYVYLLTCNYPVPASFETTRKRMLREQAQQRDVEARAREAQQELETYEQRERYDAFLVAETDTHMKNGMAQPAIDQRVRDHMARIQEGAPQYRWPETTLRGFALRKLREEVATELDLPSFEEFTRRKAETLF
jgi:hypothetical protein